MLFGEPASGPASARIFSSASDSVCAARGRCRADRTYGFSRGSAAIFSIGGLGDFQDLRLDERRLGAELREELLHLLLHALRTRQRVSWSDSMLA